MDAAALGAKLLPSLTGSAARWAWKKVRGDERLHVVAKVSCDTLASAVLDIAEDEDFAITDAEVELLTGLIGEVLDPGSLMEFCERQIAEEDGHSREEFIADLINRLEQHRWIDVNTTSLPVRTVLGEFLRLVPQQIEREAKKPGSPLLGLVLIAKLNGLRCAIDRNKQSSISESREPLYSVRTILKEPFIGRRWLLKEVNIFLQEHDRGYFLIEADAGLGKTTFAAWLAWELKCAAHFAWLDPDAGTPEVAVRSLGAQLIATWKLADLAPDGALPKDAGRAGWLDDVLHAAAERRDAEASGKPIVLVVDALDAADERPHDHLPLGLPDYLPRGVYVVATARTGALRHIPENIRGLVLEGQQNKNLEDLEEYLVWATNEQYLSNAIAEAGVSQTQFIELLLDRSGGVWVYVHYVLEEIRQDPSVVNQLPNLPRGLEAYYHNNLAKLCGGPDGHNFYTPLLATLAVAAEPVDAQTLAALTGIDEWRVEDILDHRLRPYCAITPPASKDERRRFGVYHPSLSEYLAGGLAHRSDATATGADDRPASMSTLRDRLARACREAHHRICDRYLTAWGRLDRQKKTLERLEETPERGGIDRGYALRWLTTHLLAADREDDLHYLLACGPGGRNTWFAAHDSVGDLDGYLRDVERARNSAPRLGLQLRYALIEASIASLSTTLPPVLVEELVTRGGWLAPRAISHVERMADEQRRAQTLARIARHLPAELLARALSVAVKCRRDENRVIALQAVIPRLPTDLLDAALDAVLDIENAEFFAVPMVAIAARLPKERLRELPWQRRLFRDCAVYREAAVALFLPGDRCEGAREALTKARSVDNQYERGLLVAALLPHVPGEVFDDVLAVLRTIQPGYQDTALIALAKHCPAERLGDLFDFAVAAIEAGRWKHPKAEFFQQAEPRLIEEQLPAALRLCQAVDVEDHRAEAFEALAPRLNEGQAREFLARLQDSHDKFYFFSIQPRILVVGALADRLPEKEACAVVGQQLPHLQKQVAMAKDMARLARHLPPAVRSEALSDLFRDMSLGSEFAQKGVSVLARIAPWLTDREVTEAFETMGKGTAWYPESRLVVADVLAPHLSCQQLKDALAFAKAFPLEEQCFTALAELGQFQLPETRDETALRGLAMADGISHERHKVGAVAALAPILPQDLVSEAFEIVGSIGHPWWMARAMGALAPFLPTALLPAVLRAIPGGVAGVGLDYAVRTMPRLFERLATEGCTAVIDGLLPRLEGASNWSHSVCEHLSILAPYLSPDQARRVWQIADTLWGSSRAEALSALVCRLPADEQGSAVDEVLAAFTPDAFSPERDAKILGRLARAAPTQRLIQALRDFLASRAARSALKDRFLEELSPGLPETLIEEAFQYALSTEEVDVNARALAKLAPRLSGALLAQAISYVSEQTGWHLQRTVALAALARQLPPQDRELVLASPVLKHALSAPSWSYHGRVLIDLIPHLPERLRPQAVDAQMNEARQELSCRKEFDNSIGLLPALLPVLRATELEQLYARLGETGNSRPRAAALAAVLRHTGKRHADTVFKDGRPIHHEWPLDVDRAGLLELLGASAWWIFQSGGHEAVDEVIKAIFDVIRWWP